MPDEIVVDEHFRTDCKEAVRVKERRQLISRDNPRPEAGTEVFALGRPEEEAALLLGIHRTTLRTLAVHGQAPVPPVHITEHKRIYRRIDVERLAGVVT